MTLPCSNRSYILFLLEQAADRRTVVVAKPKLKQPKSAPPANSPNFVPDRLVAWVHFPPRTTIWNNCVNSASSSPHNLRAGVLQGCAWRACFAHPRGSGGVVRGGAYSRIELRITQICDSGHPQGHRGISAIVSVLRLEA